MAEKMKLGELLIEAGLIDKIQLQSALAHQKQWGIRLGTALLELKFISEDKLGSLLEKQLNTRCISIMKKEIAPEAVNAVAPDVAKKFDVFPLELKGKTLVVATANPLDLKALDDLSFRIGKMIRPQLALESEIKRAISFYYDNVKDVMTSAPVPKPPEEQTISFEPAPPPKKEVTTKTVLDVIITLLEKKGVLTRSEISEELKKRHPG